MRATASLQPNQAWSDLRQKRQKLTSPQLTRQHGSARRVHPMKAKYILGQINSECAYFHCLDPPLCRRGSDYLARVKATPKTEGWVHPIKIVRYIRRAARIAPRKTRGYDIPTASVSLGFGEREVSGWEGTEAGCRMERLFVPTRLSENRAKTR
jgi:hypothetical protein